MEFSILSDIGAKRETNQDYAFTFINRAGYRLFLLADGMGGHKAGNIASKLTVEDLGKFWEESFFDETTSIETIEVWLRNQIRNENENISSLGKLEEYKGMGTTIEAVAVHGKNLITAHVGDSRTYLLREGKLSQITTDHSLVQELLSAGQITAEEADTHPNKNIITRSLGQTAEVTADINTLDIQEGDYILMNSDGLTNMLSDDEIFEIISSDQTIEEKTQTLIDRANEQGGKDNITVVLVHFDGPVQSQPETPDDNGEVNL
ncbi:MAG: Stp1/IreP family PP2C-type Ser/Thr phosphatase [Streptococcaceae bacterium]|nr:Stp1/IreP family PP2C-type Ser/Thr phosphatase [Streptococcaceae bacterium]MCL2681466.1 Stp1/IreP family PP2C-type Ser/Thr phosphatase [Streptococcaceae bacterium]MCL2858250.1 Stp1/IreP family PP2C-type Ser/Thr phosphatase [Streptococcaceae bacterium]